MANNQNQQKEIQIQFCLVNIEEKQFVKLCNEWPEGDMQIQNSLNYAADTEQRVVRCTTSIEFKQNDITQLILKVQAIFEFERQGWSAMYNLNEDAWILPCGLVQHLADITIGATRGVLAVRTQENGIKNIVLPLIHPSQIINNNLRFERQPAAPSEENGEVLADA